MRIVVALTLVLTLGGVTGARAQSTTAAPEDPPPGEPRIVYGLESMVTSSFVWRGLVDLDTTCLQPTAWFELGGLSVSSWVNLAHTSPGPLDFTEHDLTVDYTRTLGRVKVSAGWINYAFPDADTGRFSNEFYALASVDGVLSPSLEVYHDVQLGDGTYIRAGVSHAHPLWKQVSADFSATLGYNRHQWREGSGPSDVHLGVTLDLPIPDRGFSLRPFIGYSHGLDDEFPRCFYGGFTVAFEGTAGTKR